MLKHKLFRDKTLSVSTDIHEDGTINIDEEGFVEEGLTEEAEAKLLTIPSFEKVDYESDKDKKPEPPKPEIEVGTTKVENGKGYIYAKNSRGKLGWLRHKELDEEAAPAEPEQLEQEETQETEQEG